MFLLRCFKFICIIPFYIFLVFEGFIGGGTGCRDKWDDLCKWAKK